MSTEVYEALANTSLEWICCACGMPHFASSLFLDTISLSSNSYEFLPSNQEPEPSTLHTQFRVPISCSTPNIHTNTTKKSNTIPPKRSDKTKHVNKKLKILQMNFNSLQSTEKIARLQAHIDTENPDIIIGSETKLDESFCSSEIFPDRYHGQIFRKTTGKAVVVL